MNAREILAAVQAALPVDTKAEAEYEAWLKSREPGKKRRLARRHAQIGAVPRSSPDGSG